MNRRFGIVTIILVALTAFAGVLSFAIFSQSAPKISAVAQNPTPEVSPSNLNSSSIPTPASSAPGILRSDQPAEFQPNAFVRDPSMRLLDWSVKPFPGKSGIEMRASSWAAPGKHSFIRVEEQVQRNASGRIQILHTKEMVGDQIIVKLPGGSTQQNAEAIASKIGATAESRPFAPETWLFKLDRKLEAVPEGMENLKSSGAVIDYTEPDLIVRPTKLPNDPKVTDFTVWHLYNNAQIGKDIKAAKAWDRRTTTAYGTTNKVIIAILDTGVRYTHEDLTANMWKNPGETGTDNRGRNKQTNGVDDDRNGFVDDVYGINAIAYDGNPMDTVGHGTQCAGLVGAVGNNGIGTTGVAWSGIEIMALRFIDGTGSTSDEVYCMDYARVRGVKVINASFGQDGGSSQTEIDAITRLNTSGVILVAAAGNGGTDLVGDNNDSTTPEYPSSYPNANIISVGGTDRYDNRASFSNYGATSVDLFAPAISIYSTGNVSDSYYVSGDGTSFSTPIVTGALALLIAEYPSDSVAQRVSRIVNANAVDALPSLSGLCVTGGRLNLSKLLPDADPNTLSPALAWHRPAYTEPLLLSPMRIPTNPVYLNTATLYSGLKKFNNTSGINSNGMANQTGGWLHYRTSPSTAWSSIPLAWNSNSGDYQFWSATLSNLSVSTFQYFLQLDFDSGARTTYVHYANNPDGFTTGTDLATAQSSPYTFTVSKAPASLTISGLNQTYNGSPRSVSFTTTPSALSALVTYSGNATPPTDPGTYAVLATINDSNYQGSANANLVLGGIDDPTGDSNHNGVSNLMEYSMSGFSESSPGVSWTVSPSTPSSGSSPHNLFSLTTLVRINDPKLTYIPQACLDLSSGNNWTSSGFTISIPDQSGVPSGFQRREYQYDAGSNQRAFLKLTIQQQ